jgi:AraC-like DNA-binding protein
MHTDAEEWRRTVDAYVDECLRLRTPPRVTELAALLQMSAVRLTRLLRHSLGVSPSHYIKERQIAHAKRLLEGDAALDEIAVAAGFGTPRTFFRAFSRRTGLTPAAYRGVKKMSVAYRERHPYI